jgi:hypothetical protein
MGILDKIKDVFGKSVIDSIQDYEIEIQKLHGKALFSDIVAIIGIGGRLKGLPLVYSVKEENNFKVLVARISELKNLVKTFEVRKVLEEIYLTFKGLNIIVIPITENIAFLGVSPMTDDMTIFRDWIKKNLKNLSNLFKT